jgi:phage shock protein A
MATFLDLTKNRYSSQWRSDNARLSYDAWEKKLMELEEKIESLLDQGKGPEAQKHLERVGMAIKSDIKSLESIKDRDGALSVFMDMFLYLKHRIKG